eukprot:PhF_6_TR38668/c0_g1_i1/m.57841
MQSVIPVDELRITYFLVRSQLSSQENMCFLQKEVNTITIKHVRVYITGFVMQLNALHGLKRKLPVESTVVIPVPCTSIHPIDGVVTLFLEKRNAVLKRKRM